MSPSCFVRPDITRLFLVAGAKRLQSELIKRTPPATPEELAHAEARVAWNEAYGFWVEVKHELNAGEDHKVFKRMATMEAGEKIKLDPALVPTAKVFEYLKHDGPVWNLTDEDGRVVPYSESALLNVHGSIFNDISAAIAAHEEAVTKERDGRKNVLSGESESSSTSPLQG